MAEINIEKKKSVWPWIVAAIVVLLLIWLLVQAFDRDDDVVSDPALVTTPVYTDPATDTTMPATDATAAMTTDSDMGRFTGSYTSNNMQLNLDANGTYMMQESPAGEGRGTWMHDAGANALHLTPADGTSDRYFRIESADTLIPLNANGEPADQMAMLTRQGVVAE